MSANFLILFWNFRRKPDLVVKCHSNFQNVNNKWKNIKPALERTWTALMMSLEKMFTPALCDKN